jgi:hypothetical protein
MSKEEERQRWKSRGYSKKSYEEKLKKRIEGNRLKKEQNKLSKST